MGGLSFGDSARSTDLHHLVRVLRCSGLPPSSVLSPSWPHSSASVPGADSFTVVHNFHQTPHGRAPEWRACYTGRDLLRLAYHCWLYGCASYTEGLATTAMTTNNRWRGP